MSDIKRFDLVKWNDGDKSIEADDEGYYVLYTDHKAALEAVRAKPAVSVQKMSLPDGRADYFVSIRVGDRQVHPHAFREEFKAAYHVALYSWLLNGTEKPDLMAFDEGDWPAQATETLPTLEAVKATVTNEQIVGWQTRRNQDFLDNYPQASEYRMALSATEKEARRVGVSSAELVNGSIPPEKLAAVIVRPVYAIVPSPALEANQQELETLKAEHRAQMADMSERFRAVNVSEALRQLSNDKQVIETLRAALKDVRGSIKNARGAVESNQVTDKDVHGTLSRAIRMINAALSDNPKGEADV